MQRLLQNQGTAAVCSSHSCLLFAELIATTEREIVRKRVSIGRPAGRYFREQRLRRAIRSAFSSDSRRLVCLGRFFGEKEKKNGRSILLAVDGLPVSHLSDWRQTRCQGCMFPYLADARFAASFSAPS